MSIHFPGTERDAKPWRRLEASSLFPWPITIADGYRRLVERSEVRRESLIA